MKIMSLKKLLLLIKRNNLNIAETFAMIPAVTIEVCAFNLQSCLNAQQGGAGRIELCGNPTEGGTTPTPGVLIQARKLLNIQLYPMIRPRGGYYYYSADEIESMRQDILFCKQIGCDGISIGAQKIDGSLDVALCKEFIELAHPMKATLNKAFDLSPNLQQSLEDAVAAGFERILTSGGKRTAIDAVEIIADLVKQADKRIIIMPGCGLRSYNVAQIARGTNAREFHSAARVAIPNPLTYQNDAVHDLGAVFNADAQEVKKIKETAQAALAH
jgi:copper homeostasis protein